MQSFSCYYLNSISSSFQLHIPLQITNNKHHLFEFKGI